LYTIETLLEVNHLFSKKFDCTESVLNKNRNSTVAAKHGQST
ncbi:hypothetical protein T06_10872, partial [Trichinella sp. T6]